MLFRSDRDGGDPAANLHRRSNVPRVSPLIALLLAVSAIEGQTTSNGLSLEQVVDEALNRNLRLLAERFNISMGEARVLHARLKPNPVLSVGANYLDVFGAGFDPRTSAAGPTEVNARIDYLLERGRKRQERVAVAEAAKAVAQLGLLNSTRTLILDVQNGCALSSRSDPAGASPAPGVFGMPG